MEALTDEIQKALKGPGIGVFSIPGLVKIERRKVPARPAQKGVKNPFTGELQDRPAKPASVKVRVRALKNLKAMVAHEHLWLLNGAAAHGLPCYKKSGRCLSGHRPFSIDVACDAARPAFRRGDPPVASTARRRHT